MRYGSSNLRSSRNRLASIVALWLLCGCNGKTPDLAAAPPPPRCEGPVVETKAPGVDELQRKVEFWIEQYPDSADALVMNREQIAGHNRRARTVRGAFRDPVEPAQGVSDAIDADLEERLAYLAGRLELGALVEGEDGAFDEAQSLVEAAGDTDGWFVITQERPLWCIPMTQGLFAPPPDPAFDRNRCASLHPGELVRLLRESTDGRFVYVHAGHSVGWLERPDRSAVRDFDQALAYTASLAWAVVTRDDVELGGQTYRLGTRIPLEVPGDGALPGPEGAAPPDPDAPMSGYLVPDLDELRPLTGEGVARGFLPLTRRNLFQVAFSELGQPYGWGGTAGERDCSRLLYDVFAVFGIQLGRHSGVQANLGSRRIDVRTHSEEKKRRVIRKAANDGIVLLYMRGHIMLYLGQDEGRDFALSSLSEYLTPCGNGEDEIHRLDKVAVTTLELGRGTSRTSFIERIETVVIFDETEFSAAPRRDGIGRLPSK